MQTILRNYAKHAVLTAVIFKLIQLIMREFEKPFLN